MKCYGVMGENLAYQRHNYKYECFRACFARSPEHVRTIDLERSKQKDLPKAMHKRGDEDCVTIGFPSPTEDCYSSLRAWPFELIREES